MGVDRTQELIVRKARRRAGRVVHIRAGIGSITGDRIAGGIATGWIVDPVLRSVEHIECIDAQFKVTLLRQRNSPGNRHIKVEAVGIIHEVPARISEG